MDDCLKLLQKFKQKCKIHKLWKKGIAILSYFLSAEDGEIWCGGLFQVLRVRSRCPSSHSVLPRSTSHPGDKAVTPIITTCESLNAPLPSSASLLGLGLRRHRCPPNRPRPSSPPLAGTRRPMWRGNAHRWLAHALASVPKVTQSALEWSQSVEPRPEIKRQLERRGGNEGQMKRGKRRRAFLFSSRHPTVFPLFF